MLIIYTSMLVDYLPNHLANDDFWHKPILAKRGIRATLNDEMYPSQVPETQKNAYAPTDGREPALSTRTIIDSINWNHVPDGKLKRRHQSSSNDSDLNAEEVDLVCEYARIRGKAAHSYRSHRHPDPKEPIEVLHNELDQLSDVDDPDAMYRAVYNWNDTVTRMNHPDNVNDTTEALRSTAESDSIEIESVWRAAVEDLGLETITHEPPIVANVEETRYGTRPDEVSYTLDDSPLYPGVYNVEAKTTTNIRAKHIIQAEVQRRAVDARLGDDVHGIILHLNTDGYNTLSSHDDDWPCSEAWRLFQTNADDEYDFFTEQKLNHLPH